MSFSAPNQLFRHHGLRVVNAMAMIPFGIGILIAAPIAGEILSQCATGSTASQQFANQSPERNIQNRGLLNCHVHGRGWTFCYVLAISANLTAEKPRRVIPEIPIGNLAGSVVQRTCARFVRNRRHRFVTALLAFGLWFVVSWSLVYVLWFVVCDLWFVVNVL